MITRRHALGLLAASTLTNAQPVKDNIVFILVDDLKWNALSCLGHPWVKTPNIDRIAAEGANLKNTFVTTPLCSPSRASFLTGRYVHSHGIKTNQNNNEASFKLNFSAIALQKAGYETAHVGKIHMGNDSSPRPGFDHWVSFKGQGVYTDPPLNVDGKESRHEGYMTDHLNDYAVKFLERPHSKPFLLYLAHKAVHGPFTSADGYKGLYQGASVPKTPAHMDKFDNKPVMTRQIEGAPAFDTNKWPSEDVALNQMRCLASIDDGVGRILDTLKKTGKLDNTLVIFTSDNGYFWGEHHLGDKRWAYEDSIRIPMVARYPKWIKPGSSIEGMALNIDISPTFLEVAGLPTPSSMHGRSLGPLLRGNTRNWRKSFLAEYFEEPQNVRVPTWQAVRTAQHKYVHYLQHEEFEELYDLKADPSELKNLVNDPGSKKLLASLKAALAEINKRTP